MLVLMLLVSSLAAAGGALVPMTPAAPTRLNAVLACVGAVVCTLVWCISWRGWRHVGPLVAVAGIATVVASSGTPAGTATATLGFVWVVLYAALFLSRWLARAYVGLVAVTLGAALAANPFLGAVHTWFFVVLTAAAAVEALSGTVRRLHQQAVTDPLTGLLNREGLQRAAAPVLALTERAGGSLTVALLDLDGFKAVNDEQGHAAGDELLVELAGAWSSALRPSDLLARWGGDEFVILMPATDLDGAAEVVRRLRHVTPVGWSCGLASDTGSVSLTSLLREADAKLYDAKAARPVRPPSATVDLTAV